MRLSWRGANVKRSDWKTLVGLEVRVDLEWMMDRLFKVESKGRLEC